MRASNMSYQRMAELTQVEPHPVFGLREDFGIYAVKSPSVEVATGRALENTHAPNGIFIGNGEATQYFIPTHEKDLEYLYRIRVVND